MLSWASRIFHRIGFREPMELPEGLPEGTVGLVCSQLSSNTCIWQLCPHSGFPFQGHRALALEGSPGYLCPFWERL